MENHSINALVGGPGVQAVPVIDVSKDMQLVVEDYLDRPKILLDKLSNMCNLQSTELRDIQNLAALIQRDLGSLEDFIRNHMQLRKD